ncbi:MAG TPA: hypothetical protein ENF26_03060 [Methanomicrobia archaeon]|nr:hypothetical protein [Methanomicrobia archaeon]HEX59112.1 hypothetical protein [Methanomicrobia archaeon]
MKKEGKRYNLMDVAAYIVVHSKDKGKNPLQVGARLAHKLRLRSTETASLLTAIRMAEVFGVPSDVREEVERTVLSHPFYSELKKLL